MANANWSNPQLTSTYTAFVTEVKARDEDLAKQFDGFTGSNQITGTIRWDSTSNRWKKWDGSAWAELTATYALTGLSTTGTGSFGGNVSVTGTVDASSTITGTAFIPDGTTAPSNGLYLQSANVLGLATSSSGKVFITSSGQVGVGDATPGAKLDVVGGIKALGGDDFDGDVGFTFRTNDTDGGMFSPADNEICFATNNTKRLTIKAGKIGIGTDNPQTLLHLNNADAAGLGIRIQNTEGIANITCDDDGLFFSADNFQFQTQAGSNVLRIDTGNARLGVNTTTPSQTLDVNGTAKATTFSGSGASLTSLNATELTTGTVPDARLPNSISSSITGNAATATQLATARTIGGVSFNGTANINLPGVNTAGNQNTSGSSASCTGNSATASDLSINATNKLVIQAGNNNTQGLAHGSSGQLLKANGTNAAPTWVDLHDIGGVKGFISFNDNGTTVRQHNLTVARSATGVYVVTLDSSVQDGNTNYGVVIGNVDERRTTGNTHAVNDNRVNAWLDSRSNTNFTIKCIKFNPYHQGFGGDDEDRGFSYTRQAVDPDYISVIVF